VGRVRIRQRVLAVDLVADPAHTLFEGRHDPLVGDDRPAPHLQRLDLSPAILLQLDEALLRVPEPTDR
jgi:hypothetical protein